MIKSRQWSVLVAIAAVSLVPCLLSRSLASHSPQQDVATLEKLNAAGNSPKEIAQYVFDIW